MLQPLSEITKLTKMVTDHQSSLWSNDTTYDMTQKGYLWLEDPK